MTAEEIAARWPDAVRFALLMRETFGDVRLRYAVNAQGEVLGKPHPGPFAQACAYPSDLKRRPAEPGKARRDFPGSG